MLETSQSEPRLNTLALAEAVEELARCCASARWIDGMLARRPYAARAELLSAAREVWAELGPEDYFEAFAEHPEIGADLQQLHERFGSSADLARSEQGGTLGASEDTLLALREGNAAYRARFGYAFIVCATGKSAEEMRQLLLARLRHAPDEELGIAAAEQAKITQLRLEKLWP